jgi:uncharacterized protein (TIGR03437 family)
MDPSSIAVAPSGDLYIADINGSSLRKVAHDTGVISTVVQQFITALAFDKSGRLYYYATDGAQVWQMNLQTGNSVPVAGTPGGSGSVADGGSAINTSLGSVLYLAIASDGSLLIGAGIRVRRVDLQSGIITTAIGGGWAGGPGTATMLIGPISVATDGAGNVYISDSVLNRILAVNQSTGTIAVVAGNGLLGSTGDGGPASNAQIAAGPIVADQQGTLYLSDAVSGVIRKVDRTGQISRVATSSQLGAASCLALDSGGQNLYFATGPQVMKLNLATGAVSVAAGNGSLGAPVKGAIATATPFNAINAIAIGPNNDIYVGNAYPGSIWRVASASNLVTQIAGGGTQNQDGIPALQASMSHPWSIAIDGAGSVYFTAYIDGRVRKISSGDGTITTIAGSSYGPAFSGEGGLATSAVFGGPFGLAFDKSGSLYVADQFGHRVLKISNAVGITLSVTNGASNLAGSISPGEIVVLYGSGLGPAQIVKGTPGSDGLYPKELAGTAVSFNGITAPMIYTLGTQVAAIVPYGITDTTAQVMVTYQGQTAGAISVQVASSAPGIFSLDSTGTGQAAAINQDGFTINTAATPARTGDVISLYATGEGQTMPLGVDGKPAALPLPRPNLPVAVSIGGQTVTPIYAGGAPGEVAGLMQMNVQIPGGILTGNAVPVVLQVGNIFSQPGVTIAVR